MSDETISLQRLARDELTIRIKGTAPLIMHRFDEKTRKQMLETQKKTIRTARAAKDPDANYQASIYRLPDGRPGMPAVAFKAATIGAARNFDKRIVNMTMLKNALFFTGQGPEQLVLIDGEPVMREDVVRVGMSKTADLRYRAMFVDWTAELTVIYLPTRLERATVVALVDAGGMGGVGEWRPSKSDTGSYGTYEVQGE